MVLTATKRTRWLASSIFTAAVEQTLAGHAGRAGRYAVRWHGRPTRCQASDRHLRRSVSAWPRVGFRSFIEHSALLASFRTRRSNAGRRCHGTASTWQPARVTFGPRPFLQALTQCQVVLTQNYAFQAQFCVIRKVVWENCHEDCHNACISLGSRRLRPVPRRTCSLRRASGRRCGRCRERDHRRQPGHGCSGWRRHWRGGRGAHGSPPLEGYAALGGVPSMPPGWWQTSGAGPKIHRGGPGPAC